MLSHGATLAAGPAGAGAPTDPAPAPAPVPRHAARSSADDFVTTEERRRLAARLIRHLERNSAMTPAAVRAHVRTVEQDVYQGAGGLRKAYVAAFIRKMQDKILSPQQQRDAQRLYWEEVARLREAYGEALAARRRALKRAIRVCGTKTGYFGIELTIEKLYDDLNKVAVLIGFVSAKSAQLSAAPSMDAFPRVEAMIQALLARKIGWGVDSEDGAISGVAGTAASRASRCTVAPPSPATLAMPPPTVPTVAFLTTNLAGDEADDLMVPDLGASADAGDTGCSDNTVPVAVANVQVARASGCRGRVSAAVYASVVSTGADHRNGTGVGGDNGDSNDHCFSVVPEWSCCAEEEGGGGGGERGGGEAGGGWSGQSGVSAVVARSGDKRTSSARRVDAWAGEADEEEGADGDEFVEGCAFRAAKRQRVVY